MSKFINFMHLIHYSLRIECDMNTIFTSNYSPVQFITNKRKGKVLIFQQNKRINMISQAEEHKHSRKTDLGKLFVIIIAETYFVGICERQLRTH